MVLAGDALVLEGAVEVAGLEQGDQLDAVVAQHEAVPGAGIEHLGHVDHVAAAARASR